MRCFCCHFVIFGRIIKLFNEIAQERKGLFARYFLLIFYFSSLFGNKSGKEKKNKSLIETWNEWFPHPNWLAWILQAEDGVGLPEEILEKPNFQSVAKLYFFYIQLDFIWSLNYFALIVLNFLEVCMDFIFYFLFIFIFCY